MRMIREFYFFRKVQVHSHILFSVRVPIELWPHPLHPLCR